MNRTESEYFMPAEPHLLDPKHPERFADLAVGRCGMPTFRWPWLSFCCGATADAHAPTPMAEPAPPLGADQPDPAAVGVVVVSADVVALAFL